MGRIKKKKKKKAGLAQTTFAQAVHYCSEGTVTCEEISGMGPEHEGDKGGKKEKAKKIKKEWNYQRAGEKRGIVHVH